MLERLRMAALKTIPAGVMANLKLETFPDLIGDSLVFALTTTVLAERLAEETRTFHFSWPRGPWQRFKRRHHRLQKRFRVKYVHADATVEVRSWATFPESTLNHPDLGRPVILQEVSAHQSTTRQ